MAILGPKSYRFGLRDPDLDYGDNMYRYLEYLCHLNEFWGFHHDPIVGVNLPWPSSSSENQMPFL
jgi:hypothetical protein